MHENTTDTRQPPPISDKARARLRELEARAAVARWQTHAGIAGSIFIARQAEIFQESIKAQLVRAKADGRPDQSEP